MNRLTVAIFFRQITNLYKAFKMQDDILKDGLVDYKNLLLWYIPLFITLVFILIDVFVTISLKNTITNLISLLPSLTGFLIASLTILISMDNKMLNKKVSSLPKDKKISYRQVGAAVFIYSTKISFFLLFISFIIPDTTPEFLLQIKVYALSFMKYFIFLFFSKLLVMIFYGLLILSSAIKKLK